MGWSGKLGVTRQTEEWSAWKLSVERPTRGRKREREQEREEGREFRGEESWISRGYFNPFTSFRSVSEETEARFITAVHHACGGIRGTRDVTASAIIIIIYDV